MIQPQAPRPAPSLKCDAMIMIHPSVSESVQLSAFDILRRSMGLHSRVTISRIDKPCVLILTECTGQTSLPRGLQHASRVARLRAVQRSAFSFPINRQVLRSRRMYSTRIVSQRDPIAGRPPLAALRGYAFSPATACEAIY
jgi:hypothetical protein